MKSTKNVKKPQTLATKRPQALTVDLLRAVIGGTILTKEECKK